MKEKITGRVGRIISGGFNALIDAVENASPETMMQQALREIDDAIVDVRTELGKVIANKHMANSRLVQVSQKCEDLSEKIELAVTESRDDLAEVAIAQQLDIEAQVPILENQISELSNVEKELESYIAALLGKKREMQDELRLYKDSQKNSPGQSPGNTPNQSNNIESKVRRAESAFDRVLENATGLSTTTSVADKNTATAMKELEDLARKNRVQERLAAIKGKQGKSND